MKKSVGYFLLVLMLFNQVLQMAFADDALLNTGIAPLISDQLSGDIIETTQTDQTTPIIDAVLQNDTESKDLETTNFFDVPSSGAPTIGLMAFAGGELNASNIGELCNTTDTSCNLSNQGITSIALGTFAGYSNLQSLALDVNQITELSPGMFVGLSSLQNLTLYQNQITTITPGAFDGLPNLQSLSLNVNQISTLEPYVFSGLVNLQSLGLNPNPIKLIKANAFNGLMLSSLQLSSIGIETIESGAFLGMNNLLDLGLQANQITGFMPGVFNGIPNLTRLGLEVNQISTLNSDVFSGLSKVTYLGLGGNPIRTIKTRAFNGLSSLDGIFFQGYGIQTIESGAFVGMDNLTQLHLDSNAITDLPSNTFVGLPSLTSLSMPGNQISTIEPDTFSGLSSVTEFVLYGNPIKTLKSRAFNGLSSLSSLQLPEVGLETIESGAFLGMDSLLDLSLQGNQITNLRKSTFLGLPNLISLLLVDNLITNIDLDTFSVLPHLSTLELRLNCIDVDDLEMLAYLDSLGADYTLQDVCIGVKYSPAIPTYGTVTGVVSFMGGTAVKRLALNNDNPLISELTHIWIDNGLFVFDISDVIDLNGYVKNMGTLLTGSVSWIQDEVEPTPEEPTPEEPTPEEPTPEEPTPVPEQVIHPSVYHFASVNESTKEQTHAVAADVPTALEFMKENNLIPLTPSETLVSESPVTRGQVAQIISKFAIKVMGKKLLQTDSVSACDKFEDMVNSTESEKAYVTMSCKLGLMGWNSSQDEVAKSFNPSAPITRAEFGTILSRFLWGNLYARADQEGFYSDHLQALKDEGIISNLDPNLQEVNGWVALALYRVAQK